MTPPKPKIQKSITFQDQCPQNNSVSVLASEPNLQSSPQNFEHNKKHSKAASSNSLPPQKPGIINMKKRKNKNNVRIVDSKKLSLNLEDRQPHKSSIGLKISENESKEYNLDKHHLQHTEIETNITSIIENRPPKSILKKTSSIIRVYPKASEEHKPNTERAKFAFQKTAFQNEEGFLEGCKVDKFGQFGANTQSTNYSNINTGKSVHDKEGAPVGRPAIGAAKKKDSRNKINKKLTTQDIVSRTGGDTTQIQSHLKGVDNGNFTQKKRQTGECSNAQKGELRSNYKGNQHVKRVGQAGTTPKQRRPKRKKHLLSVPSKSATYHAGFFNPAKMKYQDDNKSLTFKMSETETISDSENEVDLIPKNRKVQKLDLQKLKQNNTDNRSVKKIGTHPEGFSFGGSEKEDKTSRNNSTLLDSRISESRTMPNSPRSKLKSLTTRAVSKNNTLTESFTNKPLSNRKKRRVKKVHFNSQINHDAIADLRQVGSRVRKKKSMSEVLNLTGNLTSSGFVPPKRVGQRVSRNHRKVSKGYPSYSNNGSLLMSNQNWTQQVHKRKKKQRNQKVGYQKSNIINSCIT